MSSILITAELLTAAGVTALVGTRRALGQLDEGVAMPALTYQRISEAPVYPINAAAGPQRMTSRMQVTALAASSVGVEALLAAVVDACSMQSGTYAGKQVIATLRDVSGPIERDAEASVWFGTQDFIVHWFD